MICILVAASGAASCAQFFLTHPIKTNVWETRMHVIAMRYLRGWFLLDVCSIFPSLFDILPVLKNCGVQIVRAKLVAWPAIAMDLPVLPRLTPARRQS